MGKTRGDTGRKSWVSAYPPEDKGKEMQGSYFNTTASSGADLDGYEAEAKSQEELMLDYFGTRPGMQYSPSQVQKHLNLTGAPLTSVRRALTNLTSAGLLQKTDKQVAGPYGRPEHCWTITRRLTLQRELPL